MSAIRSASVAIHGVDDHAAVARGIDTRIVELSADRDVIAVEVTPITETVDTIPGMVSGRTVTDRVIVTVVWREADAASAN